MGIVLTLIAPVASPATTERLLFRFAPLPVFPCPVHVLIVAQRGTMVTIMSLFAPLPLRRKELERYAKREFRKALHLLTAYALVPYTKKTGLF